MNTTKTPGSLYRKWERALRDLNPDTLPEIKGHDGKKHRAGKIYLYAIAVAIASYGSNGKGCWPAQTTIAKNLGCSRSTVSTYRRLLLDLGWFTEHNGTQRNLSIAIPAVQATAANDCHCFGCDKGESCVFEP